MKPIRAYMRKDDNFNSVKRTRGDNKDIGTSSPYVNDRETSQLFKVFLNLFKLLRIDVLGR